MTATYTPVATSRDAVRLETGDTDVANALLQDEEIDYYLTEEGDVVLRAASRSAAAIAGKFARLVSTSVEGDGAVQAQQKYEHYTQLAKSLANRAEDDDAESGGAFDIAEWVVDDFSARDILRNERLREAG